jgi:hypothetical protein
MASAGRSRARKNPAEAGPSARSSGSDDPVQQLIQSMVAGADCGAAATISAGLTAASAVGFVRIAEGAMTVQTVTEIMTVWLLFNLLFVAVRVTPLAD